MDMDELFKEYRGWKKDMGLLEFEFSRFEGVPYEDVIQSLCLSQPQEERVQTLPRRKPRQLAQKVRVESAVVEQVAEIVPEAVVAEVIAPRSEPVKAELPAVVESVADQDENGESREGICW